MQTPQKIAVAGATGRVGRHMVDVLRERGHEVVPLARSLGVDVITGRGLADALVGVDAVIDAATQSSPDQAAATDFFTTSAKNLQEYGTAAGARRIVAVSIVGIENFTASYGAAKLAHEQALREGPIPVRIVRAAQFHEFVEALMSWGQQGDVSYVPVARMQLVAARTVAEVVADIATAAEFDGPTVDVAGPREERLAVAATLLAGRRGDPLKVEEVVNEDDPDHAVYSGGGLLPGEGAILAGPTFEDWLEEEA